MEHICCSVCLLLVSTAKDGKRVHFWVVCHLAHYSVLWTQDPDMLCNQHWEFKFLNCFRQCWYRRPVTTTNSGTVSHVTNSKIAIYHNPAVKPCSNQGKQSGISWMNAAHSSEADVIPIKPDDMKICQTHNNCFMTANLVNLTNQISIWVLIRGLSKTIQTNAFMMR